MSKELGRVQIRMGKPEDLVGHWFEHAEMMCEYAQRPIAIKKKDGKKINQPFRQGAILVEVENGKVVAIA
jgi:hypothetical protein